MGVPRRQVVLAGLAAGLGTVLLGRAAVAGMAPPGGAAMVRIERFSVYGLSMATVELPLLVRSEAQWRAQLPALAYAVTRRGASEPAFSGRYLHNRQPGVYRCICCDTALFATDSQFDDGSGWLSFRQPISRYNVAESLGPDGNPNRLEVCCRRCQAHLGGVSADGPPPSHLHYRIDSVALHFIASPPY